MQSLARLCTVLIIVLGVILLGSGRSALGSWPPTITDPVPLNGNAGTDGGYDWPPSLATDGQGNWVAVWFSDDYHDGLGDDYDILVARSADHGDTWTAPVALNSNATTDLGDDSWPHVATDGQGNWITVWDSDDDLGGPLDTDTDILVARSVDNGATWTAPAPLNSTAATDAGHDGIPFITTDGLGHWVTAWASREDLGGTVGTDLDIFVARSVDNGLTWSPTTPLSMSAATASGDDQWVQLATDAQGHWVAVWESRYELGGTIDYDVDILVSRSVDNGAIWTDPAALNSNAAGAFSYDDFPSLATDGDGIWVTVWESENDLGGIIGTDFDILVSVSVDYGANWSDAFALNTNAASDGAFGDWVPVVATDTAGNWVAVWDSDNDLDGTIDTDDDILVAHSTNGGATWTAPIPLNTNADTDSAWDTWPMLAADSQGHFVAPWQSENTLGGTIGSDWDLLVARFDLPPVGAASRPAAEPGGPGCATAGDCAGAYEGADCAGGTCYIPKNRYLSINPTVNLGAVAYRVEITVAPEYPTAVGRTWWVAEPICYDYPNGDPVLPAPSTCEGADRFGWVSKLTATPVTREWTEVPLHVTECPIVPNVLYEIRASADDGASFSDPLEINTAHNPDGDTQSWGDITGGPVSGMPGLWLSPERATNMGDVGNAIRTFENRSDGTGFPPRVWVDVEINQVINLGDVQFIINAFEGAAYADLNLPLIGVHPADCP